ncbi:MAG: winged helix-turn-helix transcriptional regulator [Gemmatimonadaceae bacterium]
MPEKARTVCRDYHRAVELIGRRWTGAVIQVLMSGRSRYCEIRGAIPDVSDRMLSERLKELEAEGIVVRIVTPDTPVRVEYELSRKGRALEQALGAIARWAEEWKGASASADQPSARTIRV